MAGFGVVTGESFTESKKYKFTFLGDVDADITGMLAEAVVTGAMQIKIDLNDQRDVVEDGDYIFLNGGGKVEMVQVATAGSVVSFDNEPDTIYLDTPLANPFPANATLVRTIERVTYEVAFPGGNLLRNGVLVAEGLHDLEFHYYKESDQELVPDPISGLNQIQRAAVRKVEIRLETEGPTQQAARRYTQAIELRNMGNRPFRADTCAPAPPTNMLAARTDQCEQFTLTWTAPAANACDGTALTDLGGYKINYGLNAGEYYTPPANVPDETLTEFTVSDPRLENNTSYHVTMIAYDSSFNESIATTEILITLRDETPPEPPTNVDASAGVGSVSLTWTKSESEDVKGYRIYRGNGPGVAISPDNLIADENTLDDQAESFTDANVEACTTYYYAIVAIDCANVGDPSEEAHGDGDGQADDEPTSNVTNTTPTEIPAEAPAPPTPFQAVGRDSSVDLSWINPTASDFAGVAIRYSTVSHPQNPNDGNLLDTFGGESGQTMTATHEGLINGTWYYYAAFAFDYCGNYSDSATADAVPNASGPLVSILTPTDGLVVEDGQVVFQVQAYDPDQPGIHEPPSMAEDNGAGITAVNFWVEPDPGVLSLPHVEYQPEFCGFGGNENPCGAGDVTDWCDGTYQFYAVAFDDEGAWGVSPYVQIHVRNGGLYLDEGYTPEVTGANDNEVLFQIQNSSGTEVNLVGATFTWDRALAMVAEVEVPSGSTVWNGVSNPAQSGAEVSFSPSNPSISASSTRTVKLTFVAYYTTLYESANAGANTLTLADTQSFASGDTIYLHEGDKVEEALVGGIVGQTIQLVSPLVESFGYGTKVSHSGDLQDVDMHGADLRADFTYQKTSWYGRECISDEMDIPLRPAPDMFSAQQDEPALDTACTNVAGQLQVENYRTVPVHLAVNDLGGSGINWVKVYYFSDSSFQGVAPESGYAVQSLAYDDTEERWEGDVPYQSDVRIWFYFESEDNNGVTDREPETGAFTYDYAPDNTAPACPLALVATALSKQNVLLSWNASVEPDVQGYNVYRSDDCGSYFKVETLVVDQDPATPGVQFTTTKLKADITCYRFYVQPVDLQGNKPEGCDAYASNYVGDCPCP